MRSRKLLIAFGLFGGALLYSDGMITSEISVYGSAMTIAGYRLPRHVVKLQILYSGVNV